MCEQRQFGVRRTRSIVSRRVNRVMTKSVRTIDQNELVRNVVAVIGNASIKQGGLRARALVVFQER